MYTIAAVTKNPANAFRRHFAPSAFTPSFFRTHAMRKNAKNNGKNLVSTANENNEPAIRYFLSIAAITVRRISSAEMLSNIPCTDDCVIISGDSIHSRDAKHPFLSSSANFIVNL